MKRHAIAALSTLVLTATFTATFTVTDSQAASWGQIKNGSAAAEKATTRSISLSTTETPAYRPDGVSTSVLMGMAEMMGYRVPVIASDPDTPNAADAQRLLRWREWFLATLNTEVSFEEIVACASAVAEGRHERRHIEDVPMSGLFELARSIRYRVPVISSDPDQPTAEDAQRLLRWRTRFFDYLATGTDLADLLEDLVDAFGG